MSEEKATREYVWDQLAIAIKHSALPGPDTISVRSNIGVLVGNLADLEQWADWFDAEKRGTDVYDAQLRPGFLVRNTTAYNPSWHGWEFRVACTEYVPIEAASPQLTPGGDR